MKVVFDTNVYVSALALPRGSAAKALERIVTAEHELFLSKPILDELLGVLARKFARDREELARVALFGKERPGRVLSIEKRVYLQEQQKARSRETNRRAVRTRVEM